MEDDDFLAYFKFIDTEIKPGYTEHSCNSRHGVYRERWMHDKIIGRGGGCALVRLEVETKEGRKRAVKEFPRIAEQDYKKEIVAIAKFSKVCSTPIMR